MEIISSTSGTSCWRGLDYYKNNKFKKIEKIRGIFKKIDKGVLSANNSVWVVKSNKPIKIGKLKEEIIKIIK